MNIIEIKIKNNNNEEELKKFNLVSEKTATKIVNLIINSIVKKNKIRLRMIHDESFLTDYWFTFLKGCNFYLKNNENDYINNLNEIYYIETDNINQSNISFILTTISLLHLKYARKTIIANTIIIGNNIPKLSNATNYMISLHVSNKPKYSKLFPLCKPFDFSKKIKKYKTIEYIFNKEQYNQNRLINAVNIKNIKYIKKNYNE